VRGGYYTKVDKPFLGAELLARAYIQAKAIIKSDSLVSLAVGLRF
jgi:hypothetical protein